MNTPQVDVKHAEKEYAHISSELARYDSDSQKIISFISIIISSTFLIGLRENIDQIFLFIPLLSFTSIQYLISIKYAYKVREKYLQSLERKLRKSSGQGVPAFYSKQVKKYFLHSNLIDTILLPFSGLTFTLILLILSLGIFSGFRSYTFLKNQYEGIYSIIYLAILSLLFLYMVFSFLWGQKKLANNQ